MMNTDTTHSVSDSEIRMGDPARRTAETTTSAAETTASQGSHRIIRSLLKATLFAVLLWLSAQAGAIYIPGTPVPITLQTFVLMLAGLTLTWYEAGSSVTLYLVAGAIGLPVFAAGGSTMTLVGPSAGFLFGFLPGVMLTTVLRDPAHPRELDVEERGRRFMAYAMLTLRYALAAFIGCVIVVYVFGIALQSVITGVPLATVAIASLGFLPGGIIKAVVSACAIGTFNGLTHQR